MEIEGMIIQILDEEGGQSQRTGNQWRKKGYVLELVNGGQYPRKVKFDVWGDKIDTMLFEQGKSYMVSVDIESREFNGRWYTDVKAYAARPVEGMVQQGPVFTGGAAPQPQNPYQPAPANPYGNQPQYPQQAPQPSNPFGGSASPDFSQGGGSSEDLPF